MEKDLEIIGISKSFEGDKILNNINLSIRKGEFFSILGPSGCGKTTLLRMIAGFISPDEGEIRVNGERIDVLEPNKKR